MSFTTTTGGTGRGFHLLKRLAQHPESDLDILLLDRTHMANTDDFPLHLVALPARHRDPFLIAHHLTEFLAIHPFGQTSRRYGRQGASQAERRGAAGHLGRAALES